MFPLGDDNSDRRLTPHLNYAIIAANVAVFVLLQKMGADQGFTNSLAAVPAEILSGQDVIRDVLVRDPGTGETLGAITLGPTPIPVLGTLVTSMFLHGSWMHLIGNMLYLWIFGDNLEDRMGRLRYLLFYLVTGIAAGLTHVFVTAATGGNTMIPCVGASGAISGVLAGYLVLFPKRRVTVLIFRSLTHVPSIVAIGMWFAFQVFSGLASGGTGGGVAYGAHVGGFLAGLILVRLFAPGRAADLPRPPRFSNFP